MRTHLLRLSSRRERGQSIVIIAVAFIGLLAFIGLAVDFGMLLLQMGHLKRAVDSASLAAAVQFREGWTTQHVTDAADEFLRLNGVNLDNLSSTITTCATAPSDLQLCTTPRRKLVRVTSTGRVPFVFLPIIGIYSAPISATSVAEAASMDVVLVIDISESMTYDAEAGTAGRDPAYCNPYSIPPVDYAKACKPFVAVKEAAKRLAAWVLNKTADEEEDRLAIVVFSNGWEQGVNGTRVVSPGWMNDSTAAAAAIDNLTVYQPMRCDDPSFNGRPGLCRQYNGIDFAGMACPWANTYNDFSTCTTTNIGGGLRLAGQMYFNGMRRDALWVTILLTDGAANATMIAPEDDLGSGPGIGPADPAFSGYGSGANEWTAMAASQPIGFCPAPTNRTAPFCRDDFVLTRHASGTLATYDADDYARDQADFVGCSATSPAAACNGLHGQGALIFAVGLGAQVQTHSSGDNIPAGDALLRYVAAVGDDGDPATDPCAGVPPPAMNGGVNSYSCGNYYFTEFGGGLNKIFDDIASRIFTKIAH